MYMAQSLLEFILNLLRDSNAKTAFIADPEKALADAGLGDVCGNDVADAMSYVAEYHPVTFVGNRDDDHRNTDISQHGGNSHNSHGYQPDPHTTAVHQLEYVTNNYTYTEKHDTVIDESVNQTIWNEGTLIQSFDDHSVTATDHSVAAGRDIDGNVATGDDNIVGDGNDVGNTTTTHWEDRSANDSFNGNNIADRGSVAGADNDGNATFPSHSDVATNGSRVDESSRHDSHDTSIRDSFNDSHNLDSHNLDSRNLDSRYEDSFNNEDSFNEGSFNRESFNDDSAITHTEQNGLLNLNLSPAVNIPVHDNDVDLLSP